MMMQNILIWIRPQNSNIFIYKVSSYIVMFWSIQLQYNLINKHLVEMTFFFFFLPFPLFHLLFQNFTCLFQVCFVFLKLLHWFSMQYSVSLTFRLCLQIKHSEPAKKHHSNFSWSCPFLHSAVNVFATAHSPLPITR